VCSRRLAWSSSANRSVTGFQRSLRPS
jgi:hypothetical protein